VQYIFLYATDIYSFLPKISPETQIFNFGYKPSGHSVFTLARKWGSVVIFRRQKGSVSKMFGKHWSIQFTVCFVYLAVPTLWTSP